MSLAAFIHGHHEEIIQDFAVFAKTLMPPGIVMSQAELRDHAEEILTAVGIDMAMEQSPEERFKRSRGMGSARTMAASGVLHADHRIRHGFVLLAVLAEFRALRETVLRLFDENGGTDITDMRRFNESIDEALTASMTQFAGQTDLFRDQFIGILSHDLRNPVSAIMTGAALLAVPEDDPPRRGRVAATITKSARRMGRMIGDLLDFTRARLGGALPLTRGRMDLEAVCEDVIVECRAAHPDADLRFEKSGSLVGEWDADRLAQVVSNLVGNAIQHGEATPVALRAHEEMDGVTLTVHNGGTPIPPEAMPFIFEPLVRGQSEGGSGNVGLGLFIARAVVAAHGGEIQASSSSEGGTTFTVRLPKLNSTESVAPAPVTR
jgi:signal transduction histidine kinase